MKSHIFAVVLAAIALTVVGCASSRGRDYSDFLRELEMQEMDNAAVESDGAADAPDAPLAAGGTLTNPAGVTDDFQPLGSALTIQPDSIVRISVDEDPGLGAGYPVNDIGAIKLGYIGPVMLDNLTEVQAKEKIRRILLNRDFKTATVQVKILRASYDKCRIAGAVRRPGEIKLGSGDVVSLNNALIRAGGISHAARTTRVKIVRGGMMSAVAESLPGEVYSLVDSEGNPSVPAVDIRNNDIAFVYTWSTRARRGQRELPRWILVLGEVNQEGFYRFEPHERFTMMNLILRLGGLPQYANDKSVRVIRDEEGDEKEYRVDVRKIMKEGDPDLDFPLKTGDRVIIPARRISLF